MNIFLIITIILACAIFGLLLVLIFRKPQQQKQDTTGLDLIQQQLATLTQRVDERLHESSKHLNESLREQSRTSIQAIQNVTERLVRLDETNKQVVGFADQLKNLQDILKNPKQRGILGEYYLETTLKNVLPPKTYQMQYRFTNGEIVDAVVFVKERIIPIDSKFSLENYNRLVDAREQSEIDRLEKLFKSDIKTRIDETSKYINPDENTMDFAFMFIPHEAIYYDLLVNEVGAAKINTQDLIEYAFKKNVLIVSPTSFLAFLQTVLQGLRSLQIEESAKEIQKRVGELGRHLSAYEDYLDKLGKTLSTTVNHYNGASKEFRKIDKDVTRITGESINVEIDDVERPLLEN
ncbi:DNA recombination protein RmuC [Candidatus Nomurabacteria bacterium]|nr:DNA recombination protein RmuC [Candidatus Nomurabacteria bacterium]